MTTEEQVAVLVAQMAEVRAKLNGSEKALDDAEREITLAEKKVAEAEKKAAEAEKKVADLETVNKKLQESQVTWATRGVYGGAGLAIGAALGTTITYYAMKPPT